MAFSHVQGVQNVGTGTSLAITTAATGANNLLVVTIKITTTSVTVTSVTDSAGNTYALASGPRDYSTTMRGYQYYAVQTIPGATTVTVNVSGSATYRVQVSEFSGGETSNAAVFDVSAFSISADALQTSSSVALTPTNAGELIVSNILLGANVTNIVNGTGYTTSISVASMVQEYKLSGTTSESAGLSWTGNTNCTEIASAFIPAEVPPPATVTYSRPSPLQNKANIANLLRI